MRNPISRIISRCQSFCLVGVLLDCDDGGREDDEADGLVEFVEVLLFDVDDVVEIDDD